MLHRFRHLRRGDVAQFEKRREETAVAGGEADAQARQVRALRQRMKHDDVGEIRPGRFQHAGRRVVAVDLAVAFVGEDEEAVAARQRASRVEIGAVGDRALRVGGRGEIERDRAREQRVVSASRSGRKPLARVAGR